MKASLGGRLFNLTNIIVLALIGFVTLFPLYYVFIVSFTDSHEYLQKNGFVLFPQKWTLAAYKYLLATPAFKNATAVSTFLATDRDWVKLNLYSSYGVWDVA